METCWPEMSFFLPFLIMSESYLKYVLKLNKPYLQNGIYNIFIIKRALLLRQQSWTEENLAGSNRVYYRYLKTGVISDSWFKNSLVNMNKERKMTPSFYWWSCDLCIVCAHFVHQWEPCNKIYLNSMMSWHEITFPTLVHCERNPLVTSGCQICPVMHSFECLIWFVICAVSEIMNESCSTEESNIFIVINMSTLLNSQFTSDLWYQHTCIILL